MRPVFIHTISPFLFALTMLSACTERIDITLDSTYARLVVFGEITSENKFHEIVLSSSSDYFFNQPAPAISDALVEVVADTLSILFIEDAEKPGTYVSNIPFAGIPGTLYSLHISNVDIDMDGNTEDYKATSQMPVSGGLDSISISYFENPFASGYQVSMYALDPPTKDWYSFKLHINGVLLTDTLMKFNVQADDFFKGQYIFGFPVGFLNDEDPNESASPGDLITFELHSITREYYDFIVSAQSEIFGSNPLFGGPPANISSNIEKGGIGIFAATSFQSVTDTIPQKKAGS